MRIPAWFAALPLWLIGCGTSPTESVPDPVQVEISGPVSLAADSAVLVDEQGERTVAHRCTLELQATVSGGDSDRGAEWHSGAMFEVVDGVRDTAEEWSLEDLVDLWDGSSRLSRGETRTSRPLSVALGDWGFVFRYTDLETGEVLATEPHVVNCARGS